jgi:hypothetical protein
LTADGSVRVLSYSFGFGTANTLAAKLDDGTWLAISPSVGTPEEALQALADDGGVSALIAPNAFHHLGQGPWRQRFPQAISYAHADALPRLSKKAAGIPFRSLHELQSKLPSRVRIVEPAGLKAPDVLAVVHSGDETVWFGGDLISNTAAADMSLLARVGFGLLGGGPGFRLNPVPSIVYLKDKLAWRTSVQAVLAAAPPTAFVPAHGDAVTENTAALTLGLFKK